jgi:tetratricopeptide (TPR) repeat protein
MKKYIVIIIAVMFAASCERSLELTPEYQISTENFYRNSNDFESALVGVYGTFRGLFNSSNMLYVGELTTDNTEIQWSSPSISEMQMDQNAVTSTNSYISAVWSTCLTTVSRCNTILNRIDNVDFDVNTKNRIKGETKFLRAYSYFYLVRVFGRVPLTDQEFKSPEQILSTDLSLQPKEKIYEVILKDLTDAENLLPVALNSDKTRASRGTVKTVLGKVYLTLLNYDKAAEKLKEVVDAKQYSLVANYKSLFTSPNNNLPESILEIQYLSQRNMGNNYSYVFTPAITSMAIFQNNQQGAGRIVPTMDMINAYRPGDNRKAASVNDSVALINGTKTYNRHGLKFVDFKAVDVTDGSVTFTVLRYADVLLMYAEALNEQGKTGEAFQYINAVRNRAGLGNLSALSKEDLRLEIEKERRVEFLYEGHRWFDLTRTGRAKIVLNAYYQAQRQNFSVEDFELVFPIPQNEIDLNPAVTQNQGY